MSLPLRVQATTGTTGASFPTSLATTAFGATPKTGNIILVAIMADGLASSTQLTMTDLAGNTYTRLATSNINTIDQVDIWIGRVVKSVPSFTVTAGNLGNTTAAIVAEEWSGVLNMADVTATANDATGSSTAATATTPATAYSQAIVWVVCAINSSAITYTLGSGYTNLSQVTSNPSKLGVESKIITIGGTQTGNFTLSSGIDWMLCVATIPAGGGSLKSTTLPNSGLRPHPFSPGLAR